MTFRVIHLLQAFSNTIFRNCWQNFKRHRASGGLSATAEPLVSDDSKAHTPKYRKKIKLECGPMHNVMAALGI